MPTQVSLRHWPGMRLTWVEACAVVHAGPEPSPTAMTVVSAAGGSAEACVVVSSHTVRLLPPMIDELAGVLDSALPGATSRLRLVAWDAGCGDDTHPPPAHALATRLGVEVLAPAGPLLGVPGGSLFAPAGRGPQRPGGWWRFAPGVMPTRVGWRFPAPAWEPDLNQVAPLPHDLVVDQVPAGVWLHRPGHTSVTDLIFSVPVDPSEPAVVISHPAEVPLRPEELGRGVGALPTAASQRGVFTPYGPQPLVGGRIGDVAAAALGHSVRVRTGLPLCGDAGQRAVVAIDERGLPRWRPFARELRLAPKPAPPAVVDWVNPAPMLLQTPAGPAAFGLGAGWVVEIIEAGLWLRPEVPVDPPDWARGLPLDVDRCMVVIGTPYSPDPLPPAQMIAALLKQLPSDARSRAGMAVPRAAGPQLFQLADALRSELPDPGEVTLVGPAEPPLVPARPERPQSAPPLTYGQPYPGPFEQPQHAPPQHGRPPYEPAPRPAHEPAHGPRPVPEQPPAARNRPEAPAAAMPPIGPAVPGYPPAPPPGPLPPGPHAAPPPAPHAAPPPGSPPPPHTAPPPGAPPPGPRSAPPPAPRVAPGPHPGGPRPPGPYPPAPARGPRPEQPVPVPGYGPGPRPERPQPGPPPARPHPGPGRPPAPDDTPPGGRRPAPPEEPLRREVRSHRNAATRPQREDDRQTTQELKRLLGFFDEIRRARAWDEDPEWPDDQGSGS
jgi:hypothetical protein